MDIKDLRYFVAVYEAKGFAQASTSLHTVQSNVSARVRHLEESLGTVLFQRHRRGAIATEKGECLYRYAKRVLELMDEATHVVSDAKAA